MNKPARFFLGPFVDGKPIFEPDANASGLIHAAMGGGKTTYGVLPSIQSLMADSSQALFINDVKDSEITKQVSEMCRKGGREFVVVNPFDVLNAAPAAPESSALASHQALIAAGLLDDDA